MRTEPTVPRGAPLEPAHAVTALEQASDREQIFELLLRAVRSKTKFAALLSIHADSIRGRRALADNGFDTDRIETVRFPRKTVAAFETAINSRAPWVGTITSGEPFIDGLLESLGGSAPSVLVLPVTVANRTVALIVAHRGSSAFTLTDVADLFPLINASSPALARVVAARAKTVSGPRTAAESAGYSVEVILANAATKRAAVDKHRAAQAWEELAEAIRDLVREGMDSGDPDEDEQLSLLIELGKIEHERLGNLEKAVEAWRSAQTIDAGDPRVLDALQALFFQQGRWEECAELLEKRAALAEATAQRIEVLLELAAIAHERLGDDRRAIEAYERILGWDASNEVASRELEHLYASGEAWEPLAALLLDRASRSSGIDALEAVAQMYEDKVGDGRAAILVWTAVLRREPDRPHVLDQIDRLALTANAWDEIVPECSALAADLERNQPDTASRMWHLVGRWQRDHVGNRDEAVRAFEHALRLKPNDFDVLADQLDILRTDGRWMDLVAQLSHRAESELDHTRRAELYVELGDVYESQLGQATEAIGCYEKARAADPESLPVLIALHRLYRETESWAALGDLLPQLIEALAPTAQGAVVVDLHVELGSIFADRLQMSDEALKAFSDALALDPTNTAAYQGVQRVYAATGQTDQLLDAKEAEADASSASEQIERYAEIAQAWYERGKFDRAAACWQKLVGVDPKNFAAHEGLSVALRDGQQWAGFVVTRNAQTKLVGDTKTKNALLLEIADALESKLDDLEGACVAYQEILKTDAANRPALDALARLHDRAGRARPALEALNRLLDNTTEAKMRADLFQRVGHVHLKRDAGEARTAFAQALELDHTNPRAREGIARVHLQQGEMVAAGEELLKAAELSTDAPDIIRCLADAAWLFHHKLDDADRARDCLHKILELDPEHGPSKQALAELLQHTQQWETLWPHLEQEVARVQAGGVSNNDKFDVVMRAARCAVELGKFPAAIQLYDQAVAIDQSPATQIERAEALHRAKSFDAAANAFQQIAVHAAQLERPQLAIVYRRLAQIYSELGKPSQAQMFHQKVLDADPNHRDTLKDLAELHLGRGRFDEAIASLRTLLTTSDTAERVLLLERIGDLYRDRLKNPARATSTYMEALELDNTNHRILQRLLDMQSEAGQWKAAVETIAKFLEHERVPARRAAYYLATAEIHKNELRDRPTALEHYENALDELLREDPLSSNSRTRALEVFRLIGETITADQNWKLLEQSYRRMIKRMPKADASLVNLWHGLGEIYRTRLQHPQSAIEAFDIAHTLDPDKSPQRARILAELYAQVGKQMPQKVAERATKLVNVDPTNADAYRALGRTSLAAGNVDEAWCVARALVFLGQATGEEQALYKKYAANEVRKAAGILDEDSWQFVRSTDEDRVISAIFALSWEAACALRAGTPKSFELKSKEKLPIENNTRVVAKIFKHASRVLNVPLPDVYVQPQRPGRLFLANVIEKGRLVPAVIVGRDLMTGYRDTEIAAAIGAMLAHLRPAYYLKLTLATIDELEAHLSAACQLVGKQIGRPQLEPLVTPLVAEMKKRVSREAGERIQQLAQRLPEQLDLARWRNAVDAATQRAGLLVSGELAASARMIASESTVLGGLRPQQRVQELVAYSVSPSYFSARRHLGVGVS